MIAKPAFFEIPAAEFHRAVEFYRNALSFEISVYDCNDQSSEQMGIIKSEPISGAISQAANFKPSENGVLLSFEVDDINATLENVSKYGGNTHIEKTAIEAECGGYFAVFSDSEGNRIGLHSKS